MGDIVLEFFIGLIVVLFLAWIVTGGYKDPDADEGKFIKAPTPIDSGEVYDEPLIQ